MKCSQCQKNQAIQDNELGLLPCSSCQEKESSISKPRRYPEFSTNNIKDQRREYRRDIIQPFRDGVISKEYVEEYGSQGLSVPKKMIDNAKYTWKDTKGWWNRNKSKGGKHK